MLQTSLLHRCCVQGYDWQLLVMHVGGLTLVHACHPYVNTVYVHRLSWQPPLQQG